MRRRSLSRSWPIATVFLGGPLAGCDGGGGPTPEPSPVPPPAATPPDPADDTQQALLDEVRGLREEVARLNEQAAPAEQEPPAEPPAGPAFVPPPDHLEPFAVSFGFDDADEASHFFRWDDDWSFPEGVARNAHWRNETNFLCRYELVGDFDVFIDGYMSRSYTNSRRPKLLIAGQVIQLIGRTRASNYRARVTRVGDTLTWSVNDGEPTAVELTGDHAGPATVHLRFHNRHCAIRRLDLAADAAERDPA